MAQSTETLLILPKPHFGMLHHPSAKSASLDSNVIRCRQVRLTSNHGSCTARTSRHEKVRHFADLQNKHSVARRFNITVSPCQRSKNTIRAKYALHKAVLSNVSPHASLRKKPVKLGQ